MRTAALVLLSLAAPAFADEASESRMRMALALARAKLAREAPNPPEVKPEPPPAPTQEDQWRRDGWRQYPDGTWYRPLPAPAQTHPAGHRAVTPATWGTTAPARGGGAAGC